MLSWGLSQASSPTKYVFFPPPNISVISQLACLLEPRRGLWCGRCHFQKFPEKESMVKRLPWRYKTRFFSKISYSCSDRTRRGPHGKGKSFKRVFRVANQHSLEHRYCTSSQALLGATLTLIESVLFRCNQALPNSPQRKHSKEPPQMPCWKYGFISPAALAWMISKGFI